MAAHLEKENHIALDQYPNRQLMIHSVVSSLILTEHLEPGGDDHDKVNGWVHIGNQKVNLFKDISFKQQESVVIEKTILFVAGSKCKFQLEERDTFSNDHAVSEEADCEVGTNQKASLKFNFIALAAQYSIIFSISDDVPYSSKALRLRYLFNINRPAELADEIVLEYGIRYRDFEYLYKTSGELYTT